MIARYRTELVCDFAETYRIYDIQGLPARYAATLAVGLRDDSRTKMKMMGTKVSTQTMLLAGILDRLSVLCWQNTEDARKNRNKPISVLEKLLDTTPKEKVRAFSSAEEFEKAWKGE